MSASGPQGNSGGRRRRSDAQRNIDAIVASAAAVLGERPNASMQELAEAAGVHRATVHRHFATRDDLLRAVRRRSVEQLRQLVADPELRLAPPGDAIELLTRRAIALGGERQLYQVGAALDEASDVRDDGLALPLEDLFHRAQASGVVPSDRSAASLALAWSGLLVAALPQISRGHMSIHSAVAFVLSFVVAAADGSERRRARS